MVNSAEPDHTHNLLASSIHSVEPGQAVIAIWDYKYIYFVLLDADAQVATLSHIEESDGSEGEIRESTSGQEPIITQERLPALKLDEEILQLLRADIIPPKANFVFHQTLVDGWSKILQDGLKKDVMSELMNKYPRKGNCKIEAPTFNDEVDSMLTEKMKKRDGYFVLDQHLCGSSLVVLGTAISSIFNEEEGIDKLTLLEQLNDAGWLLSELFHLLNVARRLFFFIKYG